MSTTGDSRPIAGIGRGRGRGIQHPKRHLEKPRPLQKQLATGDALSHPAEHNENKSTEVCEHADHEDRGRRDSSVQTEKSTIHDQMHYLSMINAQNPKHQKHTGDFLTMEKQRTHRLSRVSDDDDLLCTNDAVSLSGSNSTDGLDDLFHEILYIKGERFDRAYEHDDRLESWPPHTSRTPRSSTSDECGSKLHMDSSCSYKSSNKQKKQRNESIHFAVTPKNSAVLGNPKVYGFVAMVTDTSIKKVKGGGRKGPLILEITGKENARVYAMKLLADRCNDK